MTYRLRGIAAGTLLAVLSSCGVPSDPERGPVVLLCEGTNHLESPDGSVEREALTRFYRVDGPRGSLETWDPDGQSWSGSPTAITITVRRISRRDSPKVIAGITSSKSITFDRASGTVNDEFVTSNGGMISFDGSCHAVEGPVQERKF